VPWGPSVSRLPPLLHGLSEPAPALGQCPPSPLQSRRQTPLLLHLTRVELGPFRFTLRHHNRLKGAGHHRWPLSLRALCFPRKELDRHASTLPSASRLHRRPDCHNPSPIFKPPLPLTPSYGEHRKTLPPFSDLWVPNLSLRSPSRRILPRPLPATVRPRHHRNPAAQNRLHCLVNA
jgi:hypothetical protein